MKYELLRDLLDGICKGSIYERFEDINRGPVWVAPNGNECLEWLSNFLEYHAQFSDWMRPVPETPEVAENGLNALQNAHKKEILKLANKKINAKYIAGALEHQTNLKDDTTEDQLIGFMLEEAIDQVVYVLTLMQKRGLV